MGVVRCGNHKRKCCWHCDRCPSCTPIMGRLLRGDYCKACTEKMKAEGLVWSNYHQNWVSPESKAAAEKRVAQTELFAEAQ